MKYLRYDEEDFTDLKDMTREQLEAELKDVYIRDLNQAYTIIEDLQQRIDKAIEWINNHIYTFEERNITIYDWNSLSNPKELLEILGGKQ